jgi:hypothetical protein
LADNFNFTMKNKNAVELGKIGGQTTLARYGVDHFKKIASKPRKRRKFDNKNKELPIEKLSTV